MPTFLFRNDVINISWITALFLAIVLVIFFSKTQLYQSIVQSKKIAAQNQFSRLFFRWFTQVTFVVVGSAVIAGLFQLEPVANRGLAQALGFHFEEQWRGQNIFILDDIGVIFITLLLLLMVAIIKRFFASLYSRIGDWEHYHFRTIRIQDLDLLTRAQIAKALIQALNIVQHGIQFLLVSTCLLIILSLYTVSSGISYAIGGVVSELGLSVWKGIRHILPNLLMLTVISAVTWLIFKVMRFFYDAIGKGKILVNPLHQELVEPTYQLLKLLVIAFALVAAFPYIPGSSSPVFKGISIFIGFLLSIGSSSVASNIVSGIVLTYTRGLRVGDRVQVTDTMGDVVERTLLVTRIKTIKNVVVTLPNTMVVQNQVQNFSADGKMDGLILHTAVTIGYDVPWRKVDQLLVQAAQKTGYILKYPHPFVLKTNLDDSYVSYELNAYTDKASRMATTYSDLHENILDEFNRGGVEIMSPSYLAIRSGQKTTIPKMETPKKNRSRPGNGSTVLDE